MCVFRFCFNHSELAVISTLCTIYAGINLLETHVHDYLNLELEGKTHDDRKPAHKHTRTRF